MTDSSERWELIGCGSPLGADAVGGVHSEGFTACTAHANGDFGWRYVPYGWKAAPTA